jgi:hypothetical protein
MEQFFPPRDIKLTAIYQYRKKNLTQIRNAAHAKSRRHPMTITRDGEVIAYYLESEIVCAQCATEAERTDSIPEEGLAVEELEGAVEQLWCDRCDASLITQEKAACCR